MHVEDDANLSISAIVKVLLVNTTKYEHLEHVKSNRIILLPKTVYYGQKLKWSMTQVLLRLLLQNCLTIIRLKSQTRQFLHLVSKTRAQKCLREKF